MGEVRQRGRIWWVRYNRGGRRYEESTGSDKKQTAIDLLRVREGDIAKGLPVTSRIGRLRFDEAAADVVTDYKVNGKTSREGVERKIRLHLAPFFGGRRMMAIRTADVRTYTAARQEAGASNAQINRELAILKRAFRLALQGGKLLHMPHIPMLKERNVRQGFFERADLDAVRAALPVSLRGLVTFSYLTGWRLQSEVLPLEWRQVDRKAGVVRLDPGTTKNEEGRTFPYGTLLHELRDVIEAQWREHERLKTAGIVCPLVFHRNGKRIRHYRVAWRAACEAAGCPGRLPHDMRRSAVRNFVRAGVSERTAMLLTGHKTRSVFDRYDIVNETDLQNAIGRLADASGTIVGQSRRRGRITPIRARQSRKIS
jgi:integrase